MNEIIITLDIDWCPDFVIDFVASILVEHNIKATWFVTHKSPAIKCLANYSNLFELGIHPNFLPNSSHGNNIKDIINTCLEMVPDAISMRTHYLHQSDKIFEFIVQNTSIKVDSSILLPLMPAIQPLEYFYVETTRSLVRMPYYWEDYIEMLRPEPRWQSIQYICRGYGLKILNFHPIHIYLNSNSTLKYQELKKHVSNLQSATPEDLEPFRNRNYGVYNLFLEVIKFHTKRESINIKDIYEGWKRSG